MLLVLRKRGFLLALAANHSILEPWRLPFASRKALSPPILCFTLSTYIRDVVDCEALHASNEGRTTMKLEGVGSSVSISSLDLLDEADEMVNV